jgi:uncharacterized protein YggE
MIALMDGNKTRQVRRTLEVRTFVFGLWFSALEVPNKKIRNQQQRPKVKDHNSKIFESRPFLSRRRLTYSSPLKPLIGLQERGEKMKQLKLMTGIVTVLLTLAIGVSAQQTTTKDDSRKVTRVSVSGDSTIQAQPDTAIVTVSVVNQARQASEAQQQNAAQTDAVVKALKAAVGTGAEVKTSGYSLQPQRVYKEAQPPTITGYEARNSVTVTLSDLKKVGAVIDAAGQAGANDINGILFTLKQDRPALDRALSEATKEAVSKAQLIAQALGGRVSRIVEVQEDGFQRPQPIYQEAQVGVMRAAAVSTPIEVGSLDVHSRVQLIAEIEIG